MKSIRDFVNDLPENRKELADYLLQNYSDVREKLEQRPGLRCILEKTTDEAFDKYSRYMNSWTTKVGALGHGIGYSADAWLFTGDIVGSLGGKFLNLLAQVPEKAYSLAYALKTGNYCDSVHCVLEGMVSYVPGLTATDEGLARIVQKRMVKEAYNHFLTIAAQTGGLLTEPKRKQKVTKREAIHL